MVKQVQVDFEAIKKIPRPASYETDEDWQKFFGAMKLIVPPQKHKKITHKDVLAYNSPFYESSQTNIGKEAWMIYCSFINGTLYAIRHGHRDYCFYIFQVAELLQYEHERLRTKWMPQYECFMVWLDPEGV